MGRFVETHYTADRRLYLDKNEQVVEADSPERASLYAVPGQRIRMAEAIQKGLVADNQEAKLPAEEDAAAVRLAELEQIIEAGGKENEQLQKRLENTMASEENYLKERDASRSQVKELTKERDDLKKRVADLEKSAKEKEAKAVTAPPENKALGPESVENK